MRSIETDAILFDMYYGGGSPDVEAEKTDDMRREQPVTDRTPRFQNISIKNIVCTGASRAFVIKGLPEMAVKNVVLENVSILSDKGIFLSQADGIELRNAHFAPRAGAVMTLDDCRNVTVTKLTYPQGADAFMKVSGDKSQGIQLEKVDLSLAKKGVELGIGVRSDAVTSQR
jgi:DNA sulfur modification protein DndE